MAAINSNRIQKAIQQKRIGNQDMPQNVWRVRIKCVVWIYSSYFGEVGESISQYFSEITFPLHGISTSSLLTSRSSDFVGNN